MTTISYPQFDSLGIDSSSNRVLLNLDTMPENGWITNIEVYAAGNLGTISGQLCLYDGDALDFVSSSQSWTTGVVSRTASVPNVKVSSGASIRWGCWYSAAIAFHKDDGRTGHDATGRSAQVTGPYTSYASSGLLYTLTDIALRGTLTYTPNVAPLQGTWMNPAAGGGAGLTPTFEGTIPEDAADSALDTITDLQLKITRTSDSVVVYDQTLAVTATERTNGYFSKAPITLAAGTEYKAQFRHKDSWGVAAPFSAFRTFNTSPAAIPTALTPTGKINAISSYAYTATHTHQNSLNVDQVEIELWNSTGTTRLYTSGAYVLPSSVAPGATISVNESVLTANGGHPDLAWSSGYQWRIKMRDTAAVWSPFTAYKTFNTNSPPNAPTNHAPANSQVTPVRLLTANITDPDGDTVTAAEIELYNVTDSVLVDTYVAADGVAVSGGVISFTVPSGDVTLGKTYKWRARGTDGNPSGFGAWSGYAFWIYQNVPILALVGPLSNRKNVVEEPSAEYTPGTFWTETARSAGVNEINRVNDTDTAFGDWAWEALCGASGDNRLRMTNYKTVDPTKAHPFFIWARKVSGTSAMHFNVLCYDNSNTLLGTLQPNSEGALNGTDIGTVWARYGGIVYHTGSAETIKWPAGTTKYKIEVTPSRNSAATVRFDALSRSELSPLTATEWADAKKWLGYADGDSTGYGTDLYSWAGTPGNSESNILARLTSVPASVVLNYSHLSSLAKTNDRLIIEKWNGTAFTSLYDSNPTWATSNGARTIIPIPAGTLSNEGRYRLQVQARDTVPTTGESPWAEFDVIYTGPAQLEVTVVEENVQKAQINLIFNASSLSPSVHGGTELKVLDLTTGEEWTEEYSTDPAVTQLTFHRPISGHVYEVSVRQIELVGAETVEGRWNTFEASVDYWPYFFVKDADKPGELYVAYETEASALGQTSEDVPSAIFSPWGAEDEIVLTRRRIKGGEGQINAQFYPDALNQEDHLTRYEKMKEILERRRTIILLQQVPDTEVIHAAVIGAHAKGWIPPRTPTLSFTWRRVGYEKDYYDRQGATE